MKNNISNKERFNILRGYYQNNKYHSQGGKGLSLKQLLTHLNFSKLDDFRNWYDSLEQKEIDDGTKNWCPGNCCQSLLRDLLKKTENN